MKREFRCYRLWKDIIQQIHKSLRISRPMWIRNLITWLPNALTLTNLFFGILAIRHIMIGNLADGSLCILVSLIADFFDGMAARWLKVSGPLGVQLDSLADVVTFGVAPALMMYMLSSPVHANYNQWQWGDPEFFRILSFSIALASAWRLAVFNIDAGQKEHFKGLPTPANACIPASLPLIIQNSDPYWGLQFTNPYVLLLIMVLCTWLPISKWYVMKLKWVAGGWKSNQWKGIWIMASLLLGIFFQFLSIPFVVISLLIFSYFENSSTQKTNEI